VKDGNLHLFAEAFTCSNTLKGCEMDNDFVYADKFAQDCAEAEVNPEAATYIDKVNRTRVILNLIEVAIKTHKLKIFAPGKHGPVERLIQESELGFHARDFRLKHSTAEAWFASCDAGVITTAPHPKLRVQENRILEIIRDEGFIPNALPIKVAGLPWVKADVCKKALVETKLFSTSSFNKAWERLRSSGQIVESK
jgi:hypothetical protein